MSLLMCMSCYAVLCNSLSNFSVNVVLNAPPSSKNSANSIALRIQVSNDSILFEM